MRSCKEMRQDAWNILTGSKWGWKILLNGIVLYAILVAVLIGLEFIFESVGIQTWSSFREAQLAAKRSGVDLTIASGHEALRMTFASGFSTFVEYLFQSIARTIPMAGSPVLSAVSNARSIFCGLPP